MSGHAGLEAPFHTMEEAIRTVAKILDENPEQILTPEVKQFFNDRFGLVPAETNDPKILQGAIVMKNLTQELGALAPALVRHLENLGYRVIVIGDPILENALREDTHIRVSDRPENAARILRKEAEGATIHIRGIGLEEDRGIIERLLKRQLIDDEKTTANVDEILDFVGFAKELTLDFRAAHEFIIKA